MKNLLLILSFLFLVSSCSSDDSFTEPDNPDNNAPFPVKVQVSKQEANIFEELRFTINITKSSVEMSEYYDSLAWIIPEHSNVTRKVWAYPNAGGDRLVYTYWNFVFYTDGEYHTILKGFKEGKVVMSDTVIVNISDKRDFLGFNWKDIIKSDHGFDNHYETFILNPRDYVISTRQSYLNSIPSLELVLLEYWFRYSTNNEHKKEFMEKEQEKITCDYISKLYGEPKLNYEKDAAAIATAYKAFVHKNDNCSPRYYWETDTSCIFLLQRYDERTSTWNYFVQAEPKK